MAYLLWFYKTPYPDRHYPCGQGFIEINVHAFLYCPFYYEIHQKHPAPFWEQGWGALMGQKYVNWRFCLNKWYSGNFSASADQSAHSWSWIPFRLTYCFVQLMLYMLQALFVKITKCLDILISHTVLYLEIVQNIKKNPRQDTLKP